MTNPDRIRRVIAQRAFRKLRVEARARQEAVRLRELEQRQLEKQMGKKKAKEVAEMNFRERSVEDEHDIVTAFALICSILEMKLQLV